MPRVVELRHRFVETLPDHLEPGVIYISIEFATVAHLCCCGCGRETVTPLSPRDWSVSFDGKTVSLFPSVGNWSFPCRSHYWIRFNKAIWAPPWSKERIEAARAGDWRVQEQVAHAPANQQQKPSPPTLTNPSQPI